jgi:hypothetical protein
LRPEQRSKREAAERIREFLARFGFESEAQIQGESIMFNCKWVASKKFATIELARILLMSSATD